MIGETLRRPDYAAQYPKLWQKRPPLKLSREAFQAALPFAAKEASQLAETWHGDQDQPRGPGGELLFATPGAWLILSTEKRRGVWETWLKTEWLYDWLVANKPDSGAAKLAAGSNRALESGTKQQKEGERAKFPPLLLYAGLGLAALFLARKFL